MNPSNRPQPKKRMMTLACNNERFVDKRTRDERLDDKINELEDRLKDLKRAKENGEDVCLECLGTGLIEVYCKDCT